MFQHQPTRLRQALAPMAPICSRVLPVSGRSRNSLNCAARARSCLRAVDVIEQDGHIQRCVPDLLRPCLRIRPWHMGQCLALFDLVLIPQSNRNGHPCKTPINNPTY